MNEPMLSQRRLLDAFGRLGDKLRQRGVVGEIHVVGGAVMVLEHAARDGTHDVDCGEVSPHGEIMRASFEVAAELRLPQAWLNQQASVYVPADAPWQRSAIFDHPNLRLYAIAPAALLAMKVQAGRASDVADIRFLLKLLGLQDRDEVLALVVSVFPDQPLGLRQLDALDDALDSL
jgi:hypothetical protein